ncbi:MAG: protein phosphatase CheZ [Tagaea sp.]|nr:protein phosphatase CheZ [Tagaea sp.]
MAIPQRPVFTAERHLKRDAMPPMTNGHARELRVSAPAAMAPMAEDGRTASAIEGLRGEILALGKKLDGFLDLDHTEIERIRNEVQGIASRIESTKKEIGALRHPLAQDDKLISATFELSSVVSHTEEATTKIFDGVEKIEEIMRELRSVGLDEYALSRVAEVSDVCTTIIEACSFQDLTGQRINKVVRTLAFIEERINAMLEIWGHEEVGRVAPVVEGATDLKDSGGVVLHGPQDADRTNSQADIDKLFE